MSTKIEIKDLSKNFGKKQALKHIDLEIEQGMFGLLGPNGAGKTTLMKVITTLTKKSSGEVTLCGIPVEQCGQIRKIIGYLPQDFSMYGNMGAYEALDYLAVLSGMKKKERAAKVPEMLEKVNLGDQHKTKVKAMSGGMKRRLGIAQAIIHDPKIIVVDEPTAGLDPEERVRFRNLLCEIAKDRIVILSTHIVGDIEATCENIGVLNHGEMLFQGKVSQLLEQVAGKVYTMEVSTMELPTIQERFLVTGILTNGTTAVIKIIAEEPPMKGAKLTGPDVEDAYMYLMHHQDTPFERKG
ncbi:MAG: ABC transporter ATP-binding protein [Lachnospiraceae bacterium]|nr:ABC transporter ATP-binding protein [Lachnospiraceae bacterium]